jgi:hypothetical protein
MGKRRALARKSKEPPVVLRRAPSPPLEPPPGLGSLPLHILERILLCLDIRSLQSLASTSSSMQLINGRNILDLKLPFRQDFLSELTAAASIDKKPLLRITWQTEKGYNRPKSSPSCFSLLRFQLSLLSLDNLREIIITTKPIHQSHPFDHCVLVELAEQGKLRHLSRLEGPIGTIAVFCHRRAVAGKGIGFGSLNTLAIFLNFGSRKKLGGFISIEDLILPSITAHTLRIIVPIGFLSGTYKKLYHVISSPSVERLEVTGPCSLQLRPRMARLRAVAVSPARWSGGPPCSFWQSPLEDRALHRGGQCGVDVRALYTACPLAETFNNVALPTQAEGLNFAKWMVKVKKAFYEDYAAQGGEMDWKAWGRARWSSRKMPIQRNQGNQGT